MKIFEIIDESREDKQLGYLFCLEKSGEYCIELNPGVRAEDFPIFMASFINRNIFTVDPEWSRRWVESRVIPTDRQNLGMVLRENRMKEYNLLRLLILGEGRCSQDDCAVRPADERYLPDWVRQRRYKKITFTVSIRSDAVMTAFADGSMKIYEMEEAAGETEIFPGGFGLRTEKGGYIPAEKIYADGIEIPVTTDEFRTAAKTFLLDTSEVCRELDCSRQYLDQLVRKNELRAVKTSGHVRIYSLIDVLRLKD
ncbi:MAG: hypothetical protein IJH95_06285 [Mogibacterium sp.]|nr:hypothetical protein [Mogibacterium sp.]